MSFVRSRNGKIKDNKVQAQLADVHVVRSTGSLKLQMRLMLYFAIKCTYAKHGPDGESLAGWGQAKTITVSLETPEFLPEMPSPLEARPHKVVRRLNSQTVDRKPAMLELLKKNADLFDYKNRLMSCGKTDTFKMEVVPGTKPHYKL
ncbi:hypothetical protein BV898_09211 [Hypsibius exemplaris]|uniref:Uncharacterized protein n=1 Tax=Hypsibius exemplaris TaxID=2072580 RepID=A0A1W0WNA5_HYPEX|nr:hypothetical protein BV898_09211 [Hypsibius exemplaris]